MEKKDYYRTIPIKQLEDGVEQAAGIKAVEPGAHQIARSSEHPEAYFFVDSKSKLVLINWDTGEVMPQEWTGLARGNDRDPHAQYMYWYIGRSDGERSYHAFYAQDMEDAIRKAEACRSAESAGQQAQQLNFSNGLENVRRQCETQEDDLEEEEKQPRGMSR